ncbi:MAG: PKD domain-containing protein, partial [Candidatus Binatia bacterium]
MLNITQHPTDQTVFEGQAATFSVAAAGTGSLSYQWQSGGVDVAGATGDTYTTSPATLADNGARVRVVVTDANGSVTSNDAILTVRPGGQIVVDPANPRWLRYAGGGPFFLCGPGDPENFLYRGSRNADGTRNGDQMALINKVAGTGANGIYIQMIRSHGGDGTSSHNPFIDSDPALGLDPDILDQWETWFTAMDEAGIVIYLFFFDDGANVWGPGDAVPAAEQAFLEAIVNRFKHHKRLVWVIAEEYEKVFSAQRVSNIAAVVRAADDRRHPIAMHRLSANGNVFTEFADDSSVDQFAMQITATTPDGFHSAIVAAWADAAGRYSLNMAEGHPDAFGAEARRRSWAAAMGGATIMHLRWDIASTAVADLEDCGRLVRFMESTNFNEMEPRDDLAFGGTQYVMASSSDSYILYASSLAGEIGVRSITSGTYDFHWFDIRTGTVVDQTGVVVAGGDSTWPRPSQIGTELAVWIAPSAGGGTPPATNTAPVADAGADQTASVGSLVTLSGSGSFDANGDSLTYSWQFASKPAGSTANLTGASTVSPAFTPDVAGTFVVSLVVHDGLASSASASVTITVVQGQQGSTPGGIGDGSGGTVIAMDGGTFTGTGWKTDSATSKIVVDIGEYLSQGYVEFEVRGLRTGLVGGANGKNILLAMWNLPSGSDCSAPCDAAFMQARLHTGGASGLPDGSLLFRLTSRNTTGASSSSHEGLVQGITWDPNAWYTFRATWAQDLGPGSELRLDGGVINAGSQPNPVVLGGLRYLFIGDDNYKTAYEAVRGLEFRNVKVVRTADNSVVWSHSLLSSPSVASSTASASGSGTDLGTAAGTDPATGSATGTQSGSTGGTTTTVQITNTVP